MRKEIANLWNLVEPVAKGLGFDLVELQWTRDEGGWALRVFIDRPFGPEDAPRLPGASAPDEMFRPPAVGHEDCEQVSRDLSAALDVADVIPHAYRLEVSSPGIERPLRKEEDFRRFKGQKAKIKTIDPVAGRRNFSGTLAGAEGGFAGIEIDGEDGRITQVPIDQIAKANLVPDWAAEFKRASLAATTESPEPTAPGTRRGARAHGRAPRTNGVR